MVSCFFTDVSNQSAERKSWNLKKTINKSKRGNKKISTPSKSIKNRVDEIIIEKKLNSHNEEECIRKLVEIVLAEKDYQLVTDITKKYAVIPEASKVELLTFILSSTDSDFSMVESEFNEKSKRRTNAGTALTNGFTNPPQTPKSRSPVKSKRKRRNSKNFTHVNGGSVEHMEVDDNHVSGKVFLVVVLLINTFKSTDD